MGDTIRSDAAHEWRQLCQAAFFELDPIKLLQRIVDARNAVLDGIEGTLSKPDEQRALCSALETLSTLRELAERDLGEQKKPVQTENPDSGIRWGRMMELERHNRERLKTG